MKTIALIAIATAACAWASDPAFDVASIRPAEMRKGESIETVPGSLTIRNTRLAACIQWAYSLEDYQISGPAWIQEARFDIVAKAGTPAADAQLRLMLRTLLTERFKLAVHRETKEMTALILTVAKNGHKLTPTDVEGSPSFKTGKMNLTGQGATVGQMTAFLSRAMRQPVIDRTGLTGRFNYFLDINAYVTEEVLKTAGPGGGPPPDAPSIIAQALQAQLGLKVEPKKEPVEILVVDHVEKTPTEN